MALAERGFRTIRFKATKSEITVHTSPRLARAFGEITPKMTIYQGVRLVQILEAVYQQGRKDGALAAFEQIDRGILEVKKIVPHRRPGRPRNK